MAQGAEFASGVQEGSIFSPLGGVGCTDDMDECRRKCRESLDREVYESTWESRHALKSGTPPNILSPLRLKRMLSRRMNATYARAHNSV